MTRDILPNLQRFGFGDGAQPGKVQPGYHDPQFPQGDGVFGQQRHQPLGQGHVGLLLLEYLRQQLANGIAGLSGHAHGGFGQRFQPPGKRLVQPLRLLGVPLRQPVQHGQCVGRLLGVCVGKDHIQESRVLVQFARDQMLAEDVGLQARASLSLRVKSEQQVPERSAGKIPFSAHGNAPAKIDRCFAASHAAQQGEHGGALSHGGNIVIPELACGKFPVPVTPLMHQYPVHNFGRGHGPFALDLQ